MNTKKEELRKLAEELAYTEDTIMMMADYSKQNPSSNVSRGIVNQGKNPPKNTMAKWLIVSVVGLIFFPVTIWGLYKAYQANKKYKEETETWEKECRRQEELTEFVTEKEKQREELLAKLNEICKAEPSLDGNYWWKKKTIPAVDFILLPGLKPDGEWNYMLLNQPWLTETAGGFYLENMLDFGVRIPPEDGRTLADSSKYAPVYRNDALLNKNKNGHVYAHLYAFGYEEIEEVVKGTVRTPIDKEAERRAYQKKLDSQEMIANSMFHGTAMTDEERHMFGQSSMEEYADDVMARGLREWDEEQKLRERGDYEESTHYSKGFHGLFRVILYNCADVLIDCDDTSRNNCAAILVPREKQKTIQMYVRAADKSNPFCGRVEPYGTQPGYQELDDERDMGPSIQMAVDKLMDAADAQILNLKDRDVLMEKPERLNAEEFAYLIRKDNPRSRAANLEALKSEG